MSRTLAGQLPSDVEAIDFYLSRRVDLRAFGLESVLADLPTPSLTVIGYGDGVRPGQVSIVVDELARTALRSGRSVELISGREWAGVVRASAMVGRQAVASLPSDREVDAHKMLGEMASAGGSLVVRGLDDLPASGVPHPARVVDLWLVDDVAGVAAATGVDQALTLDVSPDGPAAAESPEDVRGRYHGRLAADAAMAVGAGGRRGRGGRRRRGRTGRPRRSSGPGPPAG